MKLIKFFFLLFSLFNFNVFASNFPEKQSIFDLSIEELAELQVSSVTRKDIDLFDVPSAIYVITQEDIRRSGLSSIPEILRMAPGFHISRLDGNKWAFNGRGPDRRFQYNILLMLDGRTLYSPLTNTINWDSIDVFFQDIERIEIIRGPGSSMWGSNSANGIINIVTKSSSDTQGGLVFTEAGDGEIRHHEGIRYGFRKGDFSARFYAKNREMDNHFHPAIYEQTQNKKYYIFDPLSGSNDDGKLATMGFRADWDNKSDTSMTFQGDFYEGQFDEIRTLSRTFEYNETDSSGNNMLLRLKKRHSSDYETIIQAYYDRTLRVDDLFKDRRHIYDIDFQNSFRLGKNHINCGAGYRHIENKTENYINKNGFALNPANRYDDILSFFVQDDYHLINNKIILTFGSKFEFNDYTDFESQPSLKISYKLDKNNFFWASVSKTVSVPSRTLSDAYLDLSGYPADMCSAFGGIKDPVLGCIYPINEEDDISSTIFSFEAGYRTKIFRKLFIDVASFYDKYDEKNSEAVDLDYIYGIETTLRYQPYNNWKMEFSYTYQKGKTSDIYISDDASRIPENSIQFRSLCNIKKNMEIDLFYTFIDEVQLAESYSRLDLRLGYKISPNLKLSVLGSNLTDDHHIEFGRDALKSLTTVDRAITAKIDFVF